MRLKFLAPFLAFTLLGCSSLGTVTQAATGTISSVAPAEVNAAKKALTAAHQLHATTANFLTIAAQTNICHATCASQAKNYLDQSEAALKAADGLVALGDAPGIEAKITAATALISQVDALVGKN